MVRRTVGHKMHEKLAEFRQEVSRLFLQRGEWAFWEIYRELEDEIDAIQQWVGEGVSFVPWEILDEHLRERAAHGFLIYFEQPDKSNLWRLTAALLLALRRKTISESETEREAPRP